MGISTRTIASWVTASNQPAGLPRIDEIGFNPNKFSGTDGGSGLSICPIGTIAKFWNPTYGEGEFIYLYGVASLAIGNLVTYNPVTGLTTLSPNTANLDQPVAVSMTANTDNTKGSWFQIGGVATILKTAVKVSPNVAVFQSATTGRVRSSAASGKQLLNARTVNAATVTTTTSTITVLIQRPFLQGQVI
jgi:hypothetical protein